MDITIRNSRGKKLSGFYANDCENRLVYRQNDWVVFETMIEARRMLDRIQKMGIGKNLKLVHD